MPVVYWLSSQDMDTVTRVQILDLTDCIQNSNSKFKPVKLRLKNIDLVSYPARVEGLGKYDKTHVGKQNVLKSVLVRLMRMVSHILYASSFNILSRININEDNVVFKFYHYLEVGNKKNKDWIIEKHFYGYFNCMEESGKAEEIFINQTPVKNYL